MNSNPQVSPIQFGSQFVDINPRMGLDGRGPLLFGIDAIRSGLIILLQSHVGVQSKTLMLISLELTKKCHYLNNPTVLNSNRLQQMNSEK